MSRVAALLFFLAVSPSPRQNIAVTSGGAPVCGAVMLNENLVLTAAHCVHDAKGFDEYADVRCGSVDSPARVIKASMNEDLALLRFVMPCHDNEITTLAFSNPPIGTSVRAIGYPGGRPRMSEGIVSGYETSELSEGETVFAKHPVLISDTKIYYGNSGGGLFNVNGELVGIASQLDDAGYGYWIPVSSIYSFLRGV